MSYVERVYHFGPSDSLLGVVTLPPGDRLEASTRRPFVIILNAGLVHRVGPFRMTVELARQLAKRGLRVMRIDQAGLGDGGCEPHSLRLAFR